MLYQASDTLGLFQSLAGELGTFIMIVLGVVLSAWAGFRILYWSILMIAGLMGGNGWGDSFQYATFRRRWVYTSMYDGKTGKETVFPNSGHWKYYDL